MWAGLWLGAWRKGRWAWLKGKGRGVERVVGGAKVVGVAYTVSGRGWWRWAGLWVGAWLRGEWAGPWREGGVALTRPRPLPLQAMEEGGDVSDVVWELLESGREVGGGVT